AIVGFQRKNSLVLSLLRVWQSVFRRWVENDGKTDGQKLWGDMRTLLRSIPTGLYFQGPDKWTGNPAEALDFKSIDRAMQFVETRALKEMELAISFNALNYVTGVSLDRIALK